MDAKEVTKQLRERAARCLCAYEASEQSDSPDQIHWWDDWRIYSDAADAIDALLAENAKLKEWMRPLYQKQYDCVSCGEFETCSDDCELAALLNEKG